MVLNLGTGWALVVMSAIAFCLGALPLTGWWVQLATGRRLRAAGTGNLSVSAAFYHGGRWVGIGAVVLEAAKGIGAVLVARSLLPGAPAWELVALLALVAGRYSLGRGAGTTNVVWGYIVHDWRVAALVFLISGVSFTLMRQREQGRLVVLLLVPVILALLHPGQPGRVVAAIALSGLIALIYQAIPDDLDLPTSAATPESRRMFRFFRGDRGLKTLDDSLKAEVAGAKAATLAQLRRWGYPVPFGWVILPGDDVETLVSGFQPSAATPLAVRSSAVGEDSETASAAGQYLTLLNVTSHEELAIAIDRCFASYDQPSASRYRSDRGLADSAMAVLVQQQVSGAFSGVAFSRDPISQQGSAVVIEALPGPATRVVSGQVTPESYRVSVLDSDLDQATESWRLPEKLDLPVEGSGDVPAFLIQQVAFLARHLEKRYHGVPQDIEWTYDGQQLWLLQSRPITTLIPIWTRKIAAEVIPGAIRPLTWSINRPLTCGVWGELFTLVLGDRARGLDFTETATLHFSHAYFNASLLGDLFLRMGLPPESLEFLTRGAKFSKPPLSATMRNVPGLGRLVGRELRLHKDFRREMQQHFGPAIAAFEQQPAETLESSALLERIDRVLLLLRRATYYSILGPLSAALRQALFKVPDQALDNRRTPEVASLQALGALADRVRDRLDPGTLPPEQSEAIAALRSHPATADLMGQFDALVAEYGYLSEVGTDIAVPTWREHPQTVEEIFWQFVRQGAPPAAESSQSAPKAVQQRVDLKGEVTRVYSRLLAELRWSLMALGKRLHQQDLLPSVDTLFDLTWDEVQRLAKTGSPELAAHWQNKAQRRRSQFERDRQLPSVPQVVYGKTPPPPELSSAAPARQQFRGIGASPGEVEGRIVVLRTLRSSATLPEDAILVVPYTDSGWAPLLAQAKGLIAEVGGRLSHGAIVAREYGIPAVMDIHEATRLLRDGQRVRLNGQSGLVELL